MMSRHHGQLRDRRTIRLPGFDYAWAGAYFVTICTRDRAPIFGEVRSGTMHLNRLGRSAASQWVQIARHRPKVILNAWVIMPNHMHGIVFVTGNRKIPGSVALLAWRGSHRRFADSRAIPTGPGRGTLSAIVGSFKSATSKQINLLRGTPGAPLWHRGYYERIVGDREALTRIRQYIAENPSRW